MPKCQGHLSLKGIPLKKKKKKKQFMEPGVGGGGEVAMNGKVLGIERGREESSASIQGSLRKDSI